MRRSKRFTAIVINKRTIIAVVLCFMTGMICGGTFFISRALARATADTSGVDDIYKMALESELPIENKKENSGIIKRILGFDLFSPESILLATPIFEVLDIEYPDNSLGISPTPEPTADVQTAKYKIEGTSINKGMTLSNATKYSVTLQELLNMPMDFSLSGNGAEVLIVHTHTTESFTEEGKDTYTLQDSDRSTDENKNIVQVGKRICEVLNENGIKAIHDTTVHDYPSYNGAYNRALATIKKNIAENPEIKVVLDVHRDGMTRADGTKLKVTADVEGKTAAQVMFVVGTDSGGLKHDFWKSNAIFAAKLQEKANEMYPSLVRPLNLREERFNQHMTHGSIIIEVGSNGNTLNEAIYGGECIAKVISAVLKNS